MKSILYKTIIIFLLIICVSACNYINFLNRKVDIQMQNALTIANALSGKTFIMEGKDIPPFPLGFDQNKKHLGMCIHKTVLNFGNKVTPISNNQNVFKTPHVACKIDITTHNTTAKVYNGKCDKTKPSVTNVYKGVIMIESYNEKCFYLHLDYPELELVQEGRGQIDSNGQILYLELYNKIVNLTPHHHLCSEGCVGESANVQYEFNGKMTPVLGDSVQTYRCQ